MNSRKHTGQIATLAALLTFSTIGAEGIYPEENFAWGENIGWINFAAEHAETTVKIRYLYGYAWAENIGWIELGTGKGPYQNTNADNWGVNVEESGKLTGFAWSEGAGWINFDPLFGGVTINKNDGLFSGYAWGGNIGWIKFSGTAQDSSTYAVRTTQDFAQGTLIIVK